MPPPTHVCSKVQGSQIFKWNSIISFRSKVIVILPIWISSALGRGQVGGGIWGHLGASEGLGGVPTCTHMHAHVCTCIHTHVYMYRNCKWLPTWRHPCLACLSCLTCMCVHACMCVCVCTCVCTWDTPHTSILTPTPSTYLPAPRGWAP